MDSAGSVDIVDSADTVVIAGPVASVGLAALVGLVVIADTVASVGSVDSVGSAASAGSVVIRDLVASVGSVATVVTVVTVAFLEICIKPLPTTVFLQPQVWSQSLSMTPIWLGQWDNELYWHWISTTFGRGLSQTTTL